jgi:MFS family permease
MKSARAFFAAHAGGLPPTFWWLWSGMLLFALATFVVPFLAFFLSARGLDPMQTGLAISLFGVGSAIASPIGGQMADRLGRRPTILAALVVSALCAATLGALSVIPAIVAVVTIFGLASNVARPAIGAVVADLIPEQDRPRAFGLVYWANNVGIGASLLIGGWFAEKSWQGLFLADAATTVLFAALVWRRVPETRPPEAARDAGSRAGWSAVAADKRFCAFLGLHLVFCTVLMQFLAAAPIDMRAHGLSAQQFGYVFLVNTAMIAVLQPFVARVTAQLKPGPVLAGATALLGAGYAAYAVCGTTAQYAAATAVLSLGEIAYVPMASALVASMAPADLRGRYQGAFALGWGAASFLAPSLGSAVLGRWGSAALWIGCGAVAGTAALGQLALGRTLLRDKPAVATVS